MLLSGRFHQLGKRALLFFAQQVPVRMIPVRHLYTATVSLLRFQRAIDRERQNVVLDRARCHTERPRQYRHGRGAAGDQYAHDLRPALIHRHGRFTPFPLALAVCYHSNRKPIFRFEEFIGGKFQLIPIKKAGTSDHRLIVR